MVSLNWLNYKFIKEDGYGRYGINMVRALSRLGVDIYPGLIDEVKLPGWMQRLKGLNWSNLTIQLMPGYEMKPVPGKVWGYTMWECEDIPKGWADNINAVCERLLVPCEHNEAIFRKGGVKIPIHVIYGGTDPVEFPVLPAVQRTRPYTFLCMGDRGYRKGVNEAWGAFYEAFPDDPNVRLITKARANWFAGTDLTDSRASIWSEDTDSMADVFAQVDCFLFPSQGEGWGMPPREAAMMGLPVIATRYSGLETGIDQWAIPIDKFHMANASINPGSKCAKADVNEVARLMRWCYENREAAKEQGLQAAAWLRENQTWEHSAKQLLALIEKHL